MPALDAPHLVLVEAAPRPGPQRSQPIPAVAWPTFALALGALAVFTAAAIAAIGGCAPVWITIPLNSVAVLTSNYHLVHHLHPRLPFYRLLQAWWRNEDLYLGNDAVVTTVFGKTLTPDEYRDWKHGKRGVDSENAHLSELFVAA